MHFSCMLVSYDIILKTVIKYAYNKMDHRLIIPFTNQTKIPSLLIVFSSRLYFMLSINLEIFLFLSRHFRLEDQKNPIPLDLLLKIPFTYNTLIKYHILYRLLHVPYEYYLKDMETIQEHIIFVWFIYQFTKFNFIYLIPI